MVTTVLPFLKNPLTDRLEQLFWEKAKQRYLDEGHSLPDDVSKWARDAKQKVERYRDEYLSAERPKAELAWKEFRRISTDKITEAVGNLAASTEDEWYSQESRFDDVLVVPYEVFAYWVSAELPEVLKPIIEFGNLSNEGLQAVSDEAMHKYYDDVMRELVRQRAVVEIIRKKLHFRWPYLLTEIIDDDWYRLDDHPGSFRIKNLVLVRLDTNSDEERKQAVQKAQRYWNSVKNQRPQDRRFVGAKWDMAYSNGHYKHVEEQPASA